MNTLDFQPDAQQQAAIDALVTIGQTRHDAIRIVLGSTGTRPTVADAVAHYLATATENTRRTYRTHLRRLVEGVGPICDQDCEPCVTPVSTVDRDGDGIARGRRLVFECRCGCGPCRASRIMVPAMGDRTVSPDVLNRETVQLLATCALRIGKKSGVFENARRVKAGKSVKQADGHGAKETAIAALRSFCQDQAKYTDGYDGLDVAKPRRSSRSRRALRDFELLELSHLAETGGNDPELDSQLVELGIFTGARQEGAVNMTVGSLDRRAQLAHVDEKGDRTTPMPVPLDLIDKWIDHAVRRGGDRCDPNSPCFDPTMPLFWVKRSTGTFTPLTERRFDTLFQRLQASADWAAAEQVGFHHLRHTMSQIIKALYGQHVAQRFLRHADREVTDRYGRCDDAELARAMCDLFEFTHPLVDGVEDRRAAFLRRFGYGSPES